MSKKNAELVDIQVGQNIRAYRLAAKMSQEALGDKLGLTFQQVQKYEKGKNRVGASRLVQIADALGVPVISFFHGVTQISDTNSDGPLTNLIAEPHALRLAQAFAEVADINLRRSIVKLVENLSGRGRS